MQFHRKSVLLKKSIVALVIKKFLAFRGTQRFTAVFIEVCHWTQTFSDVSSPQPHIQFL
jgi:hypothetical protein